MTTQIDRLRQTVINFKKIRDIHKQHTPSWHAYDNVYRALTALLRFELSQNRDPEAIREDVDPTKITPIAEAIKKIE